LLGFTFDLAYKVFFHGLGIVHAKHKAVGVEQNADCQKTPGELGGPRSLPTFGLFREQSNVRWARDIFAAGNFNFQSNISALQFPHPEIRRISVETE
jgi:hypothetical protein